MIELHDLTESPVWISRYVHTFNRRYVFFLEMVKIMETNIQNNSIDIDYEIQVFTQFKSVFEGAWKTMKDYLKFQGLFQILPREIIKECFYTEILKDGQSWIDMIYDFDIMTESPFDKIREDMISNLKIKYLPALEEFNNFFEEKYNAFWTE